MFLSSFLESRRLSVFIIICMITLELPKLPYMFKTPYYIMHPYSKLYISTSSKEWNIFHFIVAITYVLHIAELMINRIVVTRKRMNCLTCKSIIFGIVIFVNSNTLGTLKGLTAIIINIGLSSAIIYLQYQRKVEYLPWILLLATLPMYATIGFMLNYTYASGDMIYFLIFSLSCLTVIPRIKSTVSVGIDAKNVK